MTEFIDAHIAKTILESIRGDVPEIEISFDLGKTTVRIDPRNQPFTVEQLEKIAKDTDSIYFVGEDGVFKAAIRGNHFYKLFPTKSGHAPALLIDGVLMHRVKDVDPIEDASMKAKLCARREYDMLEICTGLGYSTIECLKRGIRSIITIEMEKDVLELARLNPWSQMLFSDQRVSIINGDAVDKITEFNNRSFHAVLHDPPRFTMGSELYTREFYSQIYRVLKSRGVLFHYVGSPGSKYRKRDLPRGVMKRLREVGFRDVTRKQHALGVLAKKP
ncbi:MAG: methyltransferase domain-containing protein [Candidatus Thorarchaeota archaeon]